MLRPRNTHVMHVYSLVDEAGVDADGHPRQGWGKRFEAPVDAYPPAQQAAGGSERTTGGVISEADLLAETGNEMADTIAPGEDHAVVVRADGSTPRAFVVDRIRALAGRYLTPETWVIHLNEGEAGDPSFYGFE